MAGAKGAQRKIAVSDFEGSLISADDFSALDKEEINTPRMGDAESVPMDVRATKSPSHHV